MTAGAVAVADEDAVGAVGIGARVRARRRQVAAVVRVQPDRARPVAAVPPDLVSAALRSGEEVAHREVLERGAARLPDLEAVAPDRLALRVDGTGILIGGLGAALRRARLRAVDHDAVAIHPADVDAGGGHPHPRFRRVSDRRACGRSARGSRRARSAPSRRASPRRPRPGWWCRRRRGPCRYRRGARAHRSGRRCRSAWTPSSSTHRARSRRTTRPVRPNPHDA